ncbi:bacteriocin immunity protein [Photobacterium nomapromontoriensis]|uniref:bacteriocin immunity protein n=1 Tax=Photobacterium nomapromontoriensis TaxID=2910237 RepID=UPI003D133A7A
MFKNKLSDYTEQEFLDLLEKGFDGSFTPDELDKYTDELVLFMKFNTEYPQGSDLLFCPRKLGIEDSSEAVIEELKRWYTEQGLPCFKDD